MILCLNSNTDIEYTETGHRKLQLVAAHHLEKPLPLISTKVAKFELNSTNSKIVAIDL